MTMENMSELPADQQISDSSASSASQRPESPPADPDYTGSPGEEDLEPTISRAEAIPVSMSSMIDAGEFRSQMGDVTYHTLNGRTSPHGYCTSPNNYATLTPLQPLPPISTVSDKFGHVGGSPNMSGSFALMSQNNGGAIMDMTTYGHRYHPDKLGMGMNMGPTLGATAMTMMSTNNIPSYPQQSPLSYGYPTQNGLTSVKCEHKMGSPTGFESYGSSPMRLPVDHPGSPLHSPNPMTPMMVPMNGMVHVASTPSPHSESPMRERPGTSLDMQKPGQQEVEEINTKELAQRISSELKRYSIPQAVFAQRVLCRSQGTLSDLLRNPKPWSKLKSGRETFRRMWKWLQEPEFQRMSALRLAGNCAVLFSPLWGSLCSVVVIIIIVDRCLFTLSGIIICFLLWVCMTPVFLHYFSERCCACMVPLLLIILLLLLVCRVYQYSFEYGPDCKLLLNNIGFEILICVSN
jgi:nuclear factor 6 (one cut domain family protein 1)